MTIRKELLDILACPICKGKVALSDGEEGLICKRCGLMYPIQDNIPVMLIDKAVKLPQASAQAES
jgi:uncharacterized protein